jgi:hypothetical protein
MLTTDQIIQIKNRIYNDETILNEIIFGISDPKTMSVSVAERNSDGIHLNCKLLVPQRFLSSDEGLLFTEATLRAEIADCIRYILRKEFPFLSEGIKDTFCLINVLKTSKDTFDVII